MKTKKRLWNKCISVILITCMLLLNISPKIVYAGNDLGSNSSGGGGSVHTSDGTGMRSPGIIIGLKTVENKVTSEADKSAISDRNKTWTDGKLLWDECGVSVVDSYLYQYPDWFTSTNVVENHAVIVRSKNGTADNTNYFVDGTGKKSLSSFISIYPIKRNTNHVSSYTPEVIGNLIKEDATLMQKFKDRTLTLEEVQGLVNGNVPKLQEEVQKFVSIFSYTEDIATCLNGMMSKNKADAEQNALRYLDLLIIINYMCGSQYWSVIKNYLSTLNSDSSPEFSIVFMAAAVSWGTRNDCEWYTLPTYYAACTGQDVNKYMNLKGTNTTESKALEQILSTENYDMNPTAWTQAVYDNFLNVSEGKGKATYFWLWSGNKALMWFTQAQMSMSGFDNWRMAMSLMPTDIYGRKTGNTSYTYFSTAGVPAGGTEEYPKGNVYLEASSDKAMVYSGDSVTTNIKISLKTSTDTIDKLTKVFSEQLLKGVKPKLTISLSMECLEGTGTSAAPYDTMLTPTDQSLSNNKIIVNDVTFDWLKPYLDGSKIFELIDSDITITQPTTNKYAASVNIYWTDEVQADFQSKGKHGVGDTTAYDTVQWEVLPENPDKATYYSEMEEPYVEIKEGTPGNETFEAMAGVPTTEDLYVGFGATEFMLNMELERKISESNPNRIYNLYYTCSKCTEEDKACKYTCPGHEDTTYNSGCGANLGTNSDGSPKTCDSGKSNKVYCSSGVVISTSTCKCSAKSNSTTFTPVYGAGYTECIGEDGSIDYTGMGCVHTQEINTTHPHEHIFTGVVQQPIDNFAYADITDLELWEVNSLTLEGNERLFKNPFQDIDPKTGFRAYYTQEGYQDQSGRLLFDFKWEEKQRWGDTSTRETNSELHLKTDCDTLATDWMNTQITGKTVNATVISDFLVLNTTEGYQSPMYHQYVSDTVPITNNTFATGSDLKTIDGEKITFTVQPEWSEMYTNNSLSAASWDSTRITRSGYNGKYNKPSSKWSNSNITTGTDPSLYLGLNDFIHHKDGVVDFQHNFDNLRMTYIGLDVIDSTDTITKEWSAEDGLEPVSNGEWDTGRCYLRADKEIEFNNPAGINYATEADGKTYKQEVTYAPALDKVNNIVIHNPVSTEYAVVLSNNKKYDQRTASSLEEGGDPEVDEELCPRDKTCQYAYLTCTEAGTLHTEDCYRMIETGMKHVGGLNSHVCTDACNQGSAEGILKRGEYNIQLKDSVITYKIEVDADIQVYKDHEYRVYQVKKKDCGMYQHYHLWDITTDSCVSCDHVDCRHSLENPKEVPLTLFGLSLSGSGTGCTGELNTHVCTDACGKTTSKVLVCDNPHHHLPSEPWDYKSALNHYEFGDSRCYSPCEDDTKHSNHKEVSLGSGQVASNNDIFINLDREFRIYYPDRGDFAQSPTLHGISSCTKTRGMGYEDNMNTAKWTRNKYVTFPIDVIWYDSKGNSQSFYANNRIDLNKIEHDTGKEYYYTFYAVLGNHEAMNARVEFDAIATNAEEIRFYRENDNTINGTRNSSSYAAKHTAYKKQYIDIVGYIGSLTINDTGDFRFATLFKQQTNSGKWLIPNIVPEVNYNLPNKIVSDNLDVRQELSSVATNWHSAYGMTYATTGGKAYEYVKLPLTAADNPILALQKQQMRPGYQLYMDVETVGDYYGENRNEKGVLQDSNLYYKMQITPRYWKLNLDTGKYTPVDVYMRKSENYTPVVLFGNSTDSTEWYYYVDWIEEAARRNYTELEREVTYRIKEALTSGFGEPARIPAGNDVIGTANRLFLNDVNRTFIGSIHTYGVNRNPQDIFWDTLYEMQSQRWQFTLGLPSSSAFVEAGQPCTDANIEKIQNENAVIVCALDIKVKGNVWTLEYNGIGINQSDGNGIQPEAGGKIYPPPTDPETGKPLDDPIVVIYSNKYTSKDDLNTEGSH